jgi:hypothetical protein
MNKSLNKAAVGLWGCLALFPASLSAGVINEWDFKAFGGFSYMLPSGPGIQTGFPDPVYQAQTNMDGDQGSLSWGVPNSSHLSINEKDPMGDDRITTGDEEGEVIGWAVHHNLINYTPDFDGRVAVNYHLMLFDPATNQLAWDSGEMFFALQMLETVNYPTSGICPDGNAVGVGVNDNGCADRLQFGALGDFDNSGSIDAGDLALVMFNDVFDETIASFNYMGERYHVNLTGFWEFMNPNRVLVGQGWAPEMEITHFDVRAQVYVPAPATGLLFGAGLVALGLSRRRKAAH